jgi:hypothetical protein
MNAIRIHKRLDSETLHLPELKPLIGKTVEISVVEEVQVPGGAERYPLRGSVLRDDEPFAPIAGADWDAVNQSSSGSTRF